MDNFYCLRLCWKYYDHIYILKYKYILLCINFIYSAALSGHTAVSLRDSAAPLECHGCDRHLIGLVENYPVGFVGR